ncbi:hypothetical protein CFC21_075039 [Triticum aestivum]|uniref:Uncharacterized protein n=2 Tax=Triticum aestivum TaxID=4565 RepID=A0A3B6LY76_WHEAT|nr:lecithin-cholesterol acyltransferase-like 1 [Triticum aestivum]KAF7069404.1 hypothetical protein CFC21_075039 [Triticum aestivum]
MTIMGTALLRLLPLLLLLLPPPLRHYLSPASGGGASQLNVYHPIILLPGFSCSNLEARLTDAYAPSLPRCGALKGKGWFPLWNDTWTIVNHDYLPCFVEQMSLVFDSDLDDYRNLAGVETRVPDFGSAHSVTPKNNAGRDKVCLIKLRDELEALGYRDGDTLFGAPYDLRHAPPPPGQPSQVYSDYFARLMGLVQHASKKNGDKPVILVAHSFGGRVVLDFLNSTPLPWRRRFIKHLFLISPSPPTGYMLAVTNLASGSSAVQLPTVSSLALRPMWRTFASSFLSMPAPRVFGHRPLVVTKERNYSAYDYPDFLAALGFSTDEIVRFVKRVLPTMLRVDAPMVPTTYLNGIGFRTMEQVMYLEGNFDAATETVYGHGDGAATLASILAFARELGSQQRRNNTFFKFVKIPNATHAGIVIEEHALRRVMAEILQANNS